MMRIFMLGLGGLWLAIYHFGGNGEALACSQIWFAAALIVSLIDSMFPKGAGK